MGRSPQSDESPVTAAAGPPPAPGEPLPQALVTSVTRKNAGERTASRMAAEVRRPRGGLRASCKSGLSGGDREPVGELPVASVWLPEWNE